MNNVFVLDESCICTGQYLALQAPYSLPHQSAPHHGPQPPQHCPSIGPGAQEAPKSQAPQAPAVEQSVGPHLTPIVADPEGPAIDGLLLLAPQGHLCDPWPRQQPYSGPPPGPPQGPGQQGPQSPGPHCSHQGPHQAQAQQGTHLSSRLHVQLDFWYGIKKVKMV